jgi:hypothetical protein
MVRRPSENRYARVRLFPTSPRVTEPSTCRVTVPASSFTSYVPNDASYPFET